MRSAIALYPRLFGRRMASSDHVAQTSPQTRLADDLRLFATTFLGGFLFVAIYLA